MSQLGEKSEGTVWSTQPGSKLPQILVTFSNTDIVKSLVEVLPSDVLKVLGFGWVWMS